MSLETIYYIGQTVAVVAIIVSLVAIYWQQREANKLARVENTATLTSSYVDSLKSIMDNAQLAEIFSKVMYDDEKLTKVEMVQILIHFNIMVLSHRSTWMAQKRGFYDDEAFNMEVAQMRWILLKPLFVAEWKQQCEKGTYGGGFATHMNSLIKKPAKDSSKPTDEQSQEETEE